MLPTQEDALALTEWVDFFISHDDNQEKIHRSCRKHEPLSLHDAVIFFVYNKLKVIIIVIIIIIIIIINIFKHREKYRK
jgi:hypothetical protein